MDIKILEQKYITDEKKRLLPDRDKLKSFAFKLLQLNYPDVASEEAKIFVTFIKESLSDLSNDIINQSDELHRLNKN